MIEEVIPGLLQWSVLHHGIGRMVHSSFALASGTLIDPMEPDEGLEEIAKLATPERIVLTNHHHYRHSASCAKRFDCPVLCHRAGLEHFADDQPAQGFSFDEQLADGVRALELGSICPEETTLLLEVEGGVLSFGDGLAREEDGSLAFMPDRLLGEDPQRVKAGLHRNLRRMFDEDFDTLLFAHGAPMPSGGRALLGSFLSQDTPLPSR